MVLEIAVIRGGYGWIFPKGDHINVGVGGNGRHRANVGDLKDLAAIILEQETQHGTCRRVAADEHSYRFISPCHDRPSPRVSCGAR